MEIMLTTQDQIFICFFCCYSTNRFWYVYQLWSSSSSTAFFCDIPLWWTDFSRLSNSFLSVTSLTRLAFLFYYISQPRTPSFPAGLVETESNVIVRSIETGLRRWTLMAPVDAYRFLAFSDLTSACTVLPDSKETKLGSCDWLSLHWEILIMLLSQFPSTFHQMHNGMAHFIA